MPDIKKIEERKICDTRCVVIRWSNTEVQLRQLKIMKMKMKIAEIMKIIDERERQKAKT